MRARGMVGTLPGRASVAWPAVEPIDASQPMSTRHRVVCRHPSVEGEAVAGILLDARAGGVAWSDMAVLVRHEGRRWHAIRRALARNDIPATGGLGDGPTTGPEAVVVLPIETTATDRRWHTVIVAGCVEGELPRLS